jgi:3-methyl-2-oxobutanoate hydroxymethyltransferase
MYYHGSKEEAIRNAGRYMAEAGCDAVKLEGGATMAKTLKRWLMRLFRSWTFGANATINCPLGGFKSQGRDCSGAMKNY